uniref:Nudix hydrolase domain-containing protein n=1 Tax=Parascaris univalens TaxID=6257 RepID=A0A915BTA8_PARUN
MQFGDLQLSLLAAFRVLQAAKMHLKCRNIEKPYLRSSVYRIDVPDSKVDWKREWKEYQPLDYTDPSIIGKPWADKDIVNGTSLHWNSIDGNVDRRSHMGKYELDSQGRPLNPMGRTGLRGRGVLGRWGPNHAADPVVTAFRDGCLHFIGIERRDTHEWAIPGGMVDAGEKVSATLKREFTEEALKGVSSVEMESLWAKGVELFRGYVDDPRNTDNAWMETVVMNFHDDSGILEKVHFKAGSDAANVRWIPVCASERLYASHEYFIQLLAEYHRIPF